MKVAPSYFEDSALGKLRSKLRSKSFTGTQLVNKLSKKSTPNDSDPSKLGSLTLSRSIASNPIVEAISDETLNLLSSRASTMHDELILTAAVKHNFDLLVKLVTKMIPPGILESLQMASSAKENSMTEVLRSKSSIIKALRSRTLVTDPVNSLLRSGSFSLLEEVLKSRLIIPTQDEIKGFLVNKQLRLVLMSLPSLKVCKHTTHPLLKRYDIISETINLLTDPDSVIEAVSIFKHIKRQDIEAMHLKQLRYLLLKVTNPETEADCTTSKNRNPLMNCIIMSNFLDEVKHYNSRFGTFFQEFSWFYVRVAELVIKEIDDISHLRAVFAEKPFGKDTLLDIIGLQANKFRVLLKDPLMKQLVREMWTGGLELEIGFSDCSYVIASIASQQNPFTIHKMCLQPKIQSYFQLRSWLYHCGVRHAFEAFGTLVMTSYLMYIIISYTKLQQLASKPNDLTEEQGLQIKDDFATIFTAGDQVLLVYVTLNIMQAISITVYKFLTKPTLKVDPRMPFDVILGASIIQISPRLYGPYVEGDGEATPYEYIWALMSFAFLMKLLLVIVVDDKLGPILRMLYCTFVDVLRFLGIFAIILLIFSVAANLLFYQSPNFHNLQTTILTLMSAALGSVDFYAFERRELAGAIFLAVWIVVAAILIMNVLIAVLSSRYEQLSPQADADYVSLLLTFIDGAAFTDDYGGLVVASTPANVMTIPFSLLYMLPINKRRLTVFLAKLSFVPLFLCGLLSFMAFNAYWSIVSYIENFVWILKDDEKTSAEKAKNATAWMCLGGFYLTYLNAISLPVFIHFVFKSEPLSLSKAFTEADAQLTLETLKAYAEANQSEVSLSWRTAKDLVKSIELPSQEEEAIQSPRGCSGTLISKHSFKATNCERRHACLFIMKKFMSPKSDTANLEYSIQTLETRPFSWLETFSMYESLMAGKKMKQERKKKLLITI